MPNPLIVIGEDPVVLAGSIDGSSSLQIKHGSDSLASHDQTLHAKHEDLRQPTGTIRVKIMDFSHGGATWQISVSHPSGVNTIHWSRGTDHAHHDFGPMTDAVAVDVIATSNASPPQNKERRFWLKTMPSDGQGDD